MATAQELIEQAKTADSQEALDNIEMQAEGRTTVLEAIKERRDQLAGAGSGSNEGTSRGSTGGASNPPARSGGLPAAPDDAGASGEATTPADLVGEHVGSHAHTAQEAKAAERRGGQRGPGVSSPAGRQSHQQAPTGGVGTGPGLTYEINDEEGPLHQPTVLAGEPVSEHMAPPVSAIIIAPPAISGYSGRVLTGASLAVAAPAPTPNPSDPDLTAWRYERPEPPESDQDYMQALDHEVAGAETQDYTVGELVDYLEHVDDPAKLDEIAQFEASREGGPRPRALRAIEDRREDLATA